MTQVGFVLFERADFNLRKSRSSEYACKCSSAKDLVGGVMSALYLTGGNTPAQYIPAPHPASGQFLAAELVR
jgi:hypothetical protein